MRGRPERSGRPADEASFFAPATMRASPAFTRVADFDGDNQPDGIEAVVELQDRFGDPTKAAGRFIFEVYRFKPANPDPRGDRLAGPYEGRVDSIQNQRNNWSRVNRAYIFPLRFVGARLDYDYVLETWFETADGQRLNDVLTIEGDHTKPGPTSGPSPLATQPATEPATAPAGEPPATNTSGAIVTQEPRRVPTTSQPHEPPARADQP